MARFEKMGDLFEPVLELKQKLPDLKAAARLAKEPRPIEIAAQADEVILPQRSREERRGSPKKRKV